MEFFIRKGSTEPILKMAVVEDGRGFHKNDIQQRLENSVITFSMKDQNGVYKIYKKPCGIIAKENASDINPEVYYIYYKWESEDLDEAGTYEGLFDIKFYGLNGEAESNLIAPIRESLWINVI
jgi:hypothetical protein